MVCSSGAKLYKQWRAALQRRLTPALASLLCSLQCPKSSWSLLEYSSRGSEAAQSLTPSCWMLCKRLKFVQHGLVETASTST